MINEWGRAAISRSLEPAGKWLVARGIHPDAMTVFGTAGATGFAIWLIPTGHLFAASMIVWGFAMLDVLDGAMARARGVSSPFGGVLDSLCDRIVDGTVFAGIAWWAAANDRWTVVALALICLVSGQLISYIKARAEAAGLRGDGGIVERAERLILGLAGIGLTGLGLWWAVDVTLWLLTVGSLVTVAQRIATVWVSAREQYGAATGVTGGPHPPADTTEEPSSPAGSSAPRDAER
ncbi:phosphatidylinositol phosphate synthase [Actinomycetospora sp. TBRC 11914]|uniref:phosphatidylinositol phosphate synthase n=1 Tax=Actinomycetospora sp. TBRC 11914 TaxID=2729387 RepID=UPI00145D2FD2|nr:CDP-alcohol phosphatidyltransferase family protein [Actinomycetospora sp. TBRC 11914]NMO90556.1 CDP-alcohol phosphatidyltransferase family protein [Actinomycetospora sp. TBRC 11914]